MRRLLAAGTAALLGSLGAPSVAAQPSQEQAATVAAEVARDADGLTLPLPPLPPDPDAEVPQDAPAMGEEADDGLEWGVFPFVAGNTDIGIWFGASGVVAQNAPGVRPFVWRGDGTTSLSIVPEGGEDGVPEVAQQFHNLRWDFPGVADGRLRLVPQLVYRRAVNAGWFGLGNASRADLPPGLDRPGRRFQYLLDVPEARMNSRILLAESLSLMTGVHGRYVMPEAYDGSRLQSDMELRSTRGDPLLRGTTDHGLVLAAAGLLWDTRDDECFPTRGFYHEVSLRGGLGFSDAFEFGYLGLHAHTRNYLPFAGRQLVLAVRVLADLLFLDAPFYELSRGGAFFPTELPGGEDGIRGVPAGRYAGRYKLIGSFELRSMFWSFTLFGKPMQLGADLFFDGGRVWAGEDVSQDLDGKGPGFKYGFGAGVLYLWGAAAIFRLEVAWSPDAASADPDLPVGVYFAFNLSY
ncbi:MAG: BamA/TamA family outer membrane protein [Deltaproteobacteria bacterium]|nr:BamA/TamA family outer membrane protein [Deltaproteobacteria bacterium]